MTEMARAERENLADKPPPRAPNLSLSNLRPDAAPLTEGSSRATIERSLSRELLLCDRFRAQLLAAIFGGAFILFLALSASYPDAMAELFKSRMDRVRVGLLLGGFAAYELVSLRGIEKLIATRREPPAIRRYVDTLVETSLPTLTIVYYMSIVEPFEALLLPPAFVYFVFILLSTLRLDPWLCVFSGFVAAVEYALLAIFTLGAGPERAQISVLASVPHHLGKALVLLVSGVLAGFVARRLVKELHRTLESVAERSRILSVFGQHVSPAVVEQLLAQKAEGKSELREVCVMFLDIRNFTAFSERRSPEEVVDYLNTLFELTIESVNAHGGIVNKFLGDGFMAVFGAPLRGENDCRSAIHAALEIVAKLEALVAEGAIPPTRVGIGLARRQGGRRQHRLVASERSTRSSATS